MKKTLLHSILVLLPFFSISQIVVDSGAIVSIQKNAELYIPDDFENNGAVLNQGAIYIIGDITNNGSYGAVGEIHLIGGTQVVNFQKDTIQSLFVTGTSEKKIVSDVSINEFLALQNGIVIPLNESMIILLENATTSDGSISSYIQGCLYSKGEGTKYFPVGLPNVFLPVELHDIVGTDVLVAMCPGEFDTIPIAGKGTRKVLDTHYWEQKLATGTIANSQISLPILPTDTEFYGADSVVVVMSNNLLGPYRSEGENQDIISRIPDYYTSSIDTANKTYYTIGIFNDVNFKLLYIPNALSQYSPNDEEKRVKIYGSIFDNSDFSFVVTNQWGKVIFQSNSVSEMETTGWDGTNSKTGNREMIGQYYYFLEGTTKHNEPYKDAGSLWIID